MVQWEEVESIYSEFRLGRDSDYVGARVSLSKDGMTLAMGSPLSIHTSDGERTGHVKVFKQDNGTWVEDGTIHGSADLDMFGSSVAMSEMGTIIAVGADRFEEDSKAGRLLAEDGSSSERKGFVEVYQERSGGNWSMVGQRLYGDDCVGDEKYHDYFGRDVSLSNKGDVLAVGGRGIVCVFEWREANETWDLLGNPLGADLLLSEREFGSSVELAGGARIVGISIPPSYVVYEYDEDEWDQLGQYIEQEEFIEQFFVGKDDSFAIGKGLAITDDGKTIVSPTTANIYSLVDGI